MDIDAAIGIGAASGIVAALLGVVKPLLGRIGVPVEAFPALAVLLGVGWVLASWRGGVVEADNLIVAVLLGIVVGLSAVGARETFRTARPQSDAGAGQDGGGAA